MLMIAASYEDGNDADSLRADPMFKLAMERLPDHGDLCLQSTASRTENLPDRHTLLRMSRAKRLDYGLGVAPTTTLRKHVTTLEASTSARAAKAGDETLHGFKVVTMPRATEASNDASDRSRCLVARFPWLISCWSSTTRKEPVLIANGAITP